MLDLTFGEQVKIVLSRKGMTIKELAEIIEERTGKKMSRQNLTQRLGRDNFQEQDMRMIADILGCPFQLSILADINEVERASRIEDVKPTEKELSKLVRAKERKEERKENKEKRVEAVAEKKEEAPVQEAKKPEVQPRMQRYIVAGRAREESKVIEREMPKFEPSVKKRAEAPVKEEPVYEAPVEEVVEEVYEAPVEEYVEETYEAPAEDYVEETYEAPVEEYVEEVVEEVYEAPAEEAAEEVYETPVEEPEYEENTMQVEDSELAELLNEIDGIEKSSQKEEIEVPVQEDKKNRGWRSVFQRRSKKEEAPVKKEEPAVETATEEPVQETEYLDEGAETPTHYESDYIDYESTEVPEVEEVEEEPEPEEEPVVGDINPYTGEEYESNSVRMHPKRIGYVQVYDRSDHQWTDMTEWAFLGYQERKKALLGKDYEEPIYLD